MNTHNTEVILADLTDPMQGQAIIDLLNQYAKHPMGGGQALPEYSKQHLITSLSKRSDCHIILARANGQWAGLCNCFEAFSTFACKPILNIHDVYVADGYRGQGIATRMMQYAEALARELGCCKLTLEVLSENQAAKKSYRASGYEPYRLDENFGQAEFWQKNLD